MGGLLDWLRRAAPVRFVATAAGLILAGVFIVAARRAGHWRAPSLRLMLA